MRVAWGTRTPRGAATRHPSAPSLRHEVPAPPARAQVPVRLAYLLCSVPTGLGSSFSVVTAVFQLMSSG